MSSCGCADLARSPSRLSARSEWPRASGRWRTFFEFTELPCTNPTKSIQNRYNNHTTAPRNNHTTTVQLNRTTQPYNSVQQTTTNSHKNPKDPKAQGRRRRHPSRHTALRRSGGGRRPTRRAAPTPRGPQGRRRRHPPPHCATARRGKPEAYPKGRPYPHRTPRTAPATLRLLHRTELANATPAAVVPADDTPTAATTPAASTPAAATPAAIPTATATPAPASRTHATLHPAPATGPLATPTCRSHARHRDPTRSPPSPTLKPQEMARGHLQPPCAWPAHGHTQDGSPVAL